MTRVELVAWAWGMSRVTSVLGGGPTIEEELDVDRVERPLAVVDSVRRRTGHLFRTP